MVLWFMLACQGPKNEAPQSVPTDAAEDTSIERDTAPPLPPGCDGVPGSEKTYDACRVCDGTAQTCDAEMVLGYVAAGTTDDNEERLLDRLLTFGIIEGRGCERFMMIAEALPVGELKTMYVELVRSEARHHASFLHLVRPLYSEDVWRPRLNSLLDAEAEIVANLELRAALH